MKTKTEKAKSFKPMPKVPPARTSGLNDEELQMRQKMIEAADKFSRDPEMAICKKIGIGACFKF